MPFDEENNENEINNGNESVNVPPPLSNGVKFYLPDVQSQV